MNRILEQKITPEHQLQNSLFEPTDLPILPQPSFIEYWLYESPWMIAAAIVILCITGLIATRYKPKAKKIALPMCLVGFLIAAGLIATGSFITTDREILIDRSKQLIHAAANADESQLINLLDEHISFQADLGILKRSQTGRAAIITLATNHAAPIIESVKVKEVRAGLFGPRIARTHIKIHIQGDLIPPNSWWLVDWTKQNDDSSTDPNDWVVTHIEPLWIQGF